EILGLRVGIDGDLNRARTIRRRDPGRDTLARLDGDGESGAVRRLVPLRHLAKAELVAAVLGEAEADEPTRLLRHEVDRVGCGELGRDREVTLVLAVGRVDDDDELAVADVLDRLFDGGEGALFLDFHSEDGNAGRSRSTYFARTSVSRLTLSPGARPPSVVAASVCCTSATAKPSPSTAATVRETPSTVIEPFSTR